MKQNTWIVIVVGIVVLLGGSIWYADRAADKANEGIVIEEKVAGNPEAEIVVAEYSDFQCPSCAAAEPIIKELLDTYGDQVRFEYHHFPLVTIHQYAVPAARAAEAAAQQGAFWEMKELLFENQSAWSQTPNPTAQFIAYAEELQLDTVLFRQHLNAPVIENHIQESFDAARARGFTGTPTFTLNGEVMTFSSYDELLEQVGDAVGAQPATSTIETPTSTPPTL